MPISDVLIVIRWWGALFLVGAAAYPLTKRLFSSWSDGGYFFSKAVGMAVVGWLVLVIGMARIMSFSVVTIVGIMVLVFFIGMLLLRAVRSPNEHRVPMWKTLVVEEVFFFSALLFWSWVKAHEPSIRGLEKFMDYGFMNSLLHTKYFPAVDMWYPPDSINYYYFGHLVTAMVTKLSGVDLVYTFNLMLASIFAFCLTMSYSIGRELTRKISGGILTAWLVTLAGNMQTLYAFTRGYTGEDMKPFWQLAWSLGEFWKKLPEGLETYWYANATRFIPYAIHEFPSYSFVVSDVHGHVLSIPFVLLAIGLLVQMFGQSSDRLKTESWLLKASFYGFLCGVLLMTNALDGPIYFGLLVAVLVITRGKWNRTNWNDMGKTIGWVGLSTAIASFPFLSHFSSFVNGIALNCPPAQLANSKVGMLLFEGVEKCQRSELWMMALLWGFFWFCAIFWIGQKIGNIRQLKNIVSIWNNKFTQSEKLLVLFFICSMGLIIFPEIFYFKDIYPQHFRSNTMFKLGYQAFILFSIVSGYAIVSLFRKKLFLLLLLPQLFLVSIYPIFSVRSYFNSLRIYDGIDGAKWLRLEYADDFAAITWLNSQPRVKKTASIVGATLTNLVEADGDSYTDYERFSVFTGIPTVVGWAVHEWLWRGSYDIVGPRREDVRVIYESDDVERVRKLLDVYHVRFIVVGHFEREKFTQLSEGKFSELAAPAFTQGDTTIYERNTEL